MDKSLNIKNIITILKNINKDALLYIIYQLMLDGNISYHDITNLHVKHLISLEQKTNYKFTELIGKVIGMYSDSKKNYDKNLKDIIHYLRDEGRINITHEQIDKK